jgi:hypothetical protein
MTPEECINQEMSTNTIVFLAILLLCLFVFIPRIVRDLKESKRLKAENDRLRRELRDSYVTNNVQND